MNCKSTQKRLAVQREQCGETCERAKLCAICARPITAPTGSPLRASFDAWWDRGHDWGGSLQAACLSAFKAGATARGNWHFEEVEHSGSIIATLPDGSVLEVPGGRMDSPDGRKLLVAMALALGGAL